MIPMRNRPLSLAREIIAALPRGQWHGSYGMASCPVPGHGRGRGDQNPSLSIHDRDDGNIVVRCFAACDWRDVMEELCRWGLLSARAQDKPLKPPKSPVVNEDRERNQGHAIAVWRASRAAAGSLAEEYLRRRGITVALPPSIRFLDQHWHKESRRHWPTMVAGVQNAEGRLCAIHRTWLAVDGSGKAPVPLKFEKKALGPVRGGVVRLALAADSVALVEGIEDALAAQQMTGTPAWAVLGTSGFKAVELPRHIRRVIFAPDGDEAGNKVIDPAAHRLVRDGIEVRVARPPRGMDWCDMLGTFEERAAFLEHVGGEDREQAERKAWIDALGGRR